MKVLQINSVCGVGSTGRIATDLYKLIEKQGHECVIAYGRGKAPDDIKTIKIGNNLDNYFHVAKTRIFDKHGFASKKATEELVKNIKKYDPDIIHLHNIHGYYINIEILFNYLKESNKPVVWTLHDCWSFTGHCAHFDYIGCEKWKRGCFDCLQKNTYPSSVLLDNSNWNYKRKREIFASLDNLNLVTPSNWLAELLKESFLNKYNIKVINNGIDLDIFTPQKNDFRESKSIEDRFMILGVANIWGEKKGLDSFIRLNSMLDDSFKIVLVGVSEKEKNKIPKNILAISKTNSIQELAKIYSAADVFVNPTLEDNFPTTNLEALACGTPVITYNAGGSPESIDEVCGYVIEKNDVEELYEKIYECRNNNVNLMSQCVARANKYYNKDDRYMDYIDLYLDILKNK